MKIVISGINTTNVNNISWCLGAAGLAGMDTVVDITKRVVETDGDTVGAEGFGTMILMLHEYGCVVEVQQDLVVVPPILDYTVEFGTECCLAGDVPKQDGVKEESAFATLKEAVNKINTCIDTNCSEVDASAAVDIYGAAHYFDRFNNRHCVLTKVEK
jgi:hypothetical protein